jgi:hypothetical protein
MPFNPLAPVKIKSETDKIEELVDKNISDFKPSTSAGLSELFGDKNTSSEKSESTTFSKFWQYLKDLTSSKKFKELEKSSDKENSVSSLFNTDGSQSDSVSSLFLPSDKSKKSEDTSLSSLFNEYEDDEDASMKVLIPSSLVKSEKLSKSKSTSPKRKNKSKLKTVKKSLKKKSRSKIVLKANRKSKSKSPKHKITKQKKNKSKK